MARMSNPFSTEGNKIDDAISLLRRRLEFNEDLADLLIGEFIDKERYLQLRRLFKSEEKEFAIRVVRELTEAHI